ncbi:mitochondrial inner membrane protease ATP23 [Coccidioides immitis RS]|uniref:Mitochondrial inner membrane protease ATP23 n=4 Tax=Coccidioides immitis TaxID=5501 RepID=ATP23_COCIM|nr:mitochondrial inner membrane protease ATP23 [Coccidioides immitis RS]Q1E910.1 RecName: Full=Mitochondrial inner membrane protease ATP23 [Coccidioides immitis RS]KMP00861.1 Kub3-prov protein [Coccidioides immitis RMSCC 2394]KMU79981.1 Ku70-binding protein [Coccidioides immitis RMSCC 3703]KMU85526.1 Kub3-prov protein [Coccidioides immitis H538.4]TPX26172.1 Mitochondrial inner membrane protease atp23 [Coccidioides immitis]EAS35599.3 mitochondrial inner membrane protease ATP23 [Coccidioides im
MAEAASSGSNSTSPPKDNGYIPGDDAWTICRNLWRGLTGKMTQEGMEQFRVARDVRNEKEDCKRCEDQRDYLLQYSPLIRFLQDNIQQLGGNISKHNIFCRRCKNRQAGGFDPDYGIQICANEMRNQGHLEDTLAHEMIHAYDHMRFKVDWDDNLRHAACAEIRASNLSGECRWMREFFSRGQWKFAQHHQECVRRRAILSVQARPACKDEQHATQVVNEVWDSCFRDTRPFDEIYR